MSGSIFVSEFIHLSIMSHFRSSSFRQQTVDYSISTKDGEEKALFFSTAPIMKLPLHSCGCSVNITFHLFSSSNTRQVMWSSSVGSSEPHSSHRGLWNQLHIVVFTGRKANILPPPSSTTPPRTGDADAQKQHKIGFTDACAADAEQPAT